MPFYRILAVLHFLGAPFVAEPPTKPLPPTIYRVATRTSESSTSEDINGGSGGSIGCWVILRDGAEIKPSFMPQDDPECGVTSSCPGSCILNIRIDDTH